MSFSTRKRAPFGEATADIGNRKNRAAAAQLSTNIPPPSSIMGKSRSKDPPSSNSSSRLSTLPRVPVPSIRVKNGGIRSKSRQRQRQAAEAAEQQSQELYSVSTSDAHADPPSTSDDAARARIYKAAAYEAKIRIATQEQQIEALKAELSEVKFFKEVEMEQSGKSNDEAREKKSRDDAELIEALAQELERTEKDFQQSERRVGDLEHDLLEAKSKSATDIISANESLAMEKVQWEKGEAELLQQLESQRNELNNARNETNEGMAIMSDLQKALQSARSERENAGSQLANLQAQMQEKVQDATEQKAVVKELGTTLVAMQNERDKALAKVGELKESLSKYENVERSNNELQKALQTVQLQTGKKIDQMKQAVLGSQFREEKLKHDHEALLNTHEQTVRESKEMEAALAELEDEHATNMASITKDNSLEMDEMEASMNELRKELAEAEAKNKAFQAIESNYLSEIETLKDSVNESHKSACNQEEDAPDDEMAYSMENSKLRADKADLMSKLQRGMEIHQKTTLELEAKTLELQNTKTLKKDYTSAVELTISRGKKIQSLERNVEAYRSQLSKAAKKLGKKSSAEEHLEAEVSTLKRKTWEAEATITSLQEKLAQSTHKSLTEELERELVSAQKVNDESLLKISQLEEALRDMQVALKTVSSRKLSPPSSPDHMEHHEARRRDIEDSALGEYFSQRMTCGANTMG